MEIRNFDAYSPLHKSGHTSKGDQLKWKIDDRWYKADYMGYEGLSEVLVSDLLQKSTCPFPFVEYEAAVIEYNGKIFQGCSSLDFLEADQILIPLEKLYRRYTGESLAVKLSNFADVSERIQYLVTQVEEITKIDNFGAYLTAMLEIDAFFMNEDRHTNNIAVIYNEETQKYELSPFFDQGLSMFADINQDYPIDQSLEYCLGKIEAKPFSSDFDIQLDAAEELYGIQIGFQFTFKDIQIYLQKNSENYPREVIRRVEQLLRRQMRKYGYLMKK